MAKPLRLGILLSGGGRTLENILEHIRAGKVPAEVAVTIASRPSIRGIEISRAAGIPTHLVRPRDFQALDGTTGGQATSATQAYSDAMVEVFDEARVDLVCLAGFLSFWIIPQRYLGRVMNIHPALLPAFGGKGMYGHHVHEAVIARGCKVSGCTVHFVDNEYDAGPIVLQRTVPVYAEDTADDVAARVFEEECIAFPEGIRLYAEGRLRIDGKIVRIEDGKYKRPPAKGSQG